MKKLLLTLGFLPLFCYAQATMPLSPTKVALAKFLTEGLSYAYLEKFNNEYYQKLIKFYQLKYEDSDKSLICKQTIQALKYNLDYQHQLDSDKIKNQLVMPSVSDLSDKQAERILNETKNDLDFFNHPPSKDSQQLITSITQRIGIIKADGTAYDINDALKNCPTKTQ